MEALMDTLTARVDQLVEADKHPVLSTTPTSVAIAELLSDFTTFPGKTKNARNTPKPSGSSRSSERLVSGDPFYERGSVSSATSAASPNF